MKTAIALATAAALIALTGAAAHDPERKTIRTVIVHKDGKSAHHAHAMMHGGKCEEATAKSDVDVESPGEGGKKQRTRVLVCNSDADPAKARAQVLEALTKARADLADGDRERLAAEHRDKALAALDREIAKLRGQ